MSSTRKPLIRSNSQSDKITMRNWPLFIFLIGLVLFFYIFYIYQAQGTNLSMANDEILLLTSQLSATKSKLVDAMASLETSDAAKKTIEIDFEATKKGKDECLSSLRTSTMRLKELETDARENREKLISTQQELKELQEKFEAIQKNNTALQNFVGAQEQLVQQLNQTVALLKFETSQLRGAAAAEKQVEMVATATGSTTPALKEEMEKKEEAEKIEGYEGAEAGKQEQEEEGHEGAEAGKEETSRKEAPAENA